MKRNRPKGLADPDPKREAKRKLPALDRYAHLVYFGFVAMHGPYHIVAGICLAIGLAMLALRVNDQ